MSDVSSDITSDITSDIRSDITSDIRSAQPKRCASKGVSHQLIVIGVELIKMLCFRKRLYK